MPSSGAPKPQAQAQTQAQALFCLHDCTLDLMAIITSYVDEHDFASFALANSYHLLVHHTLTKQQPAAQSTQQAPCPCPYPLGLGYIERPRFLYPGEKNGETVALVSYPRSGNSMLRGLLESVTGVVTGSDTRPDRVLSRSLLKKGLRGEGVVDERAWVVKTHWPERYGYRRFPAQRVILLVRNPFDAINSYFNMGMTNTHEKTLKDDIYLSLKDLWEEMAQNEVKVWAKFNSHWLMRGLPVLAVRYEDLLLHTEEMLVRLVSFLEKTPHEAVRASPLSMARIRKTAALVKRSKAATVVVAEDKNKDNQDKGSDKIANGNGNGHGMAPAAAAAPAVLPPNVETPPASDPSSPAAPPSGRVSDPLQSNRPRGGGKIGASLRYYSKELLEEMSSSVGGAMRAFGYDPITQSFPHQLLSLPPYERCVKFVDPSLLSTAVPPSSSHPPPPAAAATAAAAPANDTASTTLNKGRQLRDPHDRFGRNITKTRHDLTDHDRRPLPTVAAPPK